MFKKLELTAPLDGETEFSSGGNGENCTDIRRADGGYAIHNGNARRVVPDNQVRVYREELRPGVTREREAPKFADRAGDGWKCKACKFEAPTLHAVKVHHAKVHTAT